MASQPLQQGDGQDGVCWLWVRGAGAGPYNWQWGEALAKGFFLILIRKVSFIRKFFWSYIFIYYKVLWSDLPLLKKILHKNQDAAEEGPCSLWLADTPTLKNATFILRRVSELDIDLLGPTQNFFFSSASSPQGMAKRLIQKVSEFSSIIRT